MPIKTSALISGLALLCLIHATGAHSAQQRLRMATTTSTDNSGLLQQLNPAFESQSGVRIDVIAVGTGKALKLGENGDVDLVFVHAPVAEKKFVAAGHGLKRFAVMHNDFIIIGPKSNPAGLKEHESGSEALRRIAQSQAIFISRGDESGTHIKEQQLWRGAGINPQGNWYLATGQGMGAVLQIAADKDAYSLTDRGTYIAYQKKIELQILNQGSAELFNPYHIIAVNPQHHPHTKTDLANRYIRFITGPAGQKLISSYRLGSQQLFYPDVTQE
jgi:tungstate transport system substrate-binding protein